MNEYPVVKALKSTIEIILQQHPEHENLIKVFKPILVCEEELLQKIALQKPICNPKKNTPNEPCFTLENISICVDKSGIIKEALLTSFREGLLEYSKEIQILQKFFTAKNTRQYCKEYLATKDKPALLHSLVEAKLLPLAKRTFKTKSNTKIKVDESNLMQERLFNAAKLFLSRVGHVFTVRAARSIPPFSTDIMLQTCPYCGQKPQMSVIQKIEGERSLLCSACNGLWRYKRTACPNCGVDEAGNLQLTYANNNIKERGVSCQKCNTYILEVDLKERDIANENIHALTLGIAYLDIIMQQNKYSPIIG